MRQLAWLYSMPGIQSHKEKSLPNELQPYSPVWSLSAFVVQRWGGTQNLTHACETRAPTLGYHQFIWGTLRNQAKERLKNTGAYSQAKPGAPGCARVPRAKAPTSIVLKTYLAWFSRSKLKWLTANSIFYLCSSNWTRFQPQGKGGGVKGKADQGETKTRNFLLKAELGTGQKDYRLPPPGSCHLLKW